jgi:hypothetical protein
MTMSRYLHKARELTTAVLLAAVTAGSLLVGTAPAQADPPSPPCGSPEVPCAGPSPLTPEQQCALIAWRTLTPCNWVGVQVPAGTPGSWG